VIDATGNEAERCEHCRQMYPERTLCALENYRLVLCPGCYHCWRYGAPDIHGSQLVGVLMAIEEGIFDAGDM
jgi:flavoprotein